MKIALVDNGSVEAAAHQCLRSAASAIGARADVPIEAVSWRHSGRIPADALKGNAALTLAPWIRSQVSSGEREFLLVPYFISPQGAIGSSLRRDLAALQEDTGGFEFSISEGLSRQSLCSIVSDRVRETSRSAGLQRPPVIVVDHGGPSRPSAEIRDGVAEAARAELGGDIGPLVAASMESPDGPGFEFSRPLLGEALSAPGFDSGDVVIAPLFLSPGRHAGPGGDLEVIARAAQARAPRLRCHFTGLVGLHPTALETLARALVAALRVGIPS